MVRPCSLLDHIRGVKGDIKRAVIHEPPQTSLKRRTRWNTSGVQRRFRPKICPEGTFTPQAHLGMCLGSQWIVIAVHVQCERSPHHSKDRAVRRNNSLRGQGIRNRSSCCLIAGCGFLSLFCGFAPGSHSSGLCRFCIGYF